MRNANYRCRLIALSLLASMLTPPVFFGTAEASEHQAAAALAAYNSRNLGDPALRRVRMDLYSADRLVNSFTIVNTWRRMPNGAETLFLLEHPYALRGTAYLLREKLSPTESSDMSVSMFLPAGRRRVLQIASALFDQGLLGADFSYRDMRLLLPAGEGAFRFIRMTTCLNEPCMILEFAGVAHWSRVLIHLAANGELIYGMDYFERGENSPSKSIRVEAVARIGSVLTATRMVATQGDARRSVISLLEFSPHSALVSPESFAEGSLPYLGERYYRKLQQKGGAPSK